MLAVEDSGQRMIIGLDDHAFSDPLPKLRLGGPKLFSVAADDQGGLPLLLLFFLVFVRLTHFRLQVASIHLCLCMDFRLGADLNAESERSHTWYPIGKPLMRGGIRFSK